MVDEVAKTALVYDATGAEAGGARFVAASQKIIDSENKRATEAERVAVRVIESQARQMRAVDSLARRLDPLGQSARDAARDLDRLQSIAAGSGAGAERAATLVAAAQQRLAQATTATAAAHGQATAAFDKSSYAVRQFGMQSIDVFQGLATGQPIMTTFIQQGSQIAQTTAAAGVGMGQLARGIGAVLIANAPLIAATATVAAFGVAIYSVFSRSAELEAQQRTLSVAIQGVGRSAELSTGQLQGYVTQLKKQGVESADAVASIAQLARASNLSGGMIGQIAGMAPDAAAAMGTSVTEATRQLMDAARGSAESVQKLDEAFNLLTANEAASIRQMIDHGDKAGALEKVFGKLKERIDGLNAESLSPTEKAFRDLGNAWDDFMTRIVKSDPVMKVIAQLRRDVQGITNAVFGASGSDLSHEIVAANNRLLQLQADAASATGSGPAAQAMAQSRNAEIANLRKQIDDMTARARAEAPLLPTDAAAGNLPTPPLPGSARGSAAVSDSKEIDNIARGRVSSTTAGQIATYRNEINKFKGELDQLGPRTTDNAARFDVLTAAIKANEKSIVDAEKKTEEHRTGLEKAIDTINAQIKAQEELSAAYGVNQGAVAGVLAKQEAQKRAITEGLVPGTEKYRKVVEDLTGRLLDLNTATGEATIKKQVAAANDQVEAQIRVAKAYDGTAESITKAQNYEKAYAEAQRANLIPGTQQFEQAVARLAETYDRASYAASSFEQAQQSVQALTNSLGNAFDRLGQGLVDAFLSGSGAAVNFSNIAKSIVASLATDLVKLAIANPLKNALFGGSSATLSSGLSALTGGGATDGASGGGMGSLLNTGSNLFSLARATDTLGLTNLGGQFSSIGNSLGLTGDGGLLAGVGGIMNAPIFGASTALAAENAAITSTLGAGVYGPAVPGAAGLGATTLGGALAGIGGGFALGSMAGGFLQSSLNKTGPAPMIGAGAGALGGFLIGGPVGGLIGGLLGGGAGGFIGPKPASAFSSTGIGLDNGQLSLGQTVSQIVDTSQEVANASQQLAQINQFLSSSGITITSLGKLSQIGQNTPGGFVDPSKFSDINSAFGQFSFGAPNNDVLNRALSGKTFSTIADVQAVVTQITTFTDQTMPALIALGKTDTTYGLGALGDQIKNLTDQFTAAITQAQDLGIAEGDLATARDKALQAANDNAVKQYNAMSETLAQRAVAAEAANTGNAALIRDATLRGFDAVAQKQRDDLESQLLALFGDGFKGSSGFADEMALLERALGAERLSIVKQYNDQITATEQQAAQQAAQQRAAELAQQQGQATQNVTGLLANISQYVRSISTGGASPLSPQGQFDLASRQFDAAFGAARAGDFNSTQNLTSLADTKLTAARGLYGSGAGYVQAYNEVITALEQFSSLPAERLTNSSLEAIQKATTQPVVDGLEAIRQGIAELRLELRQVANGPPASRAA